MDWSVHPRAGGEHGGGGAAAAQFSGSSPRGRGTHTETGHREGDGRFIPARAGNTDDRVLARIGFPVHPRAGGEHEWFHSTIAPRIGSSPRGRGTPLHLHAPSGCHRFIPARAGNTPAPRWRRTGSSTGSSPRGRGTRRPDLERRVDGRFIPARAGNTQCALPPRSVCTVHPRAGGEHREICGDAWRLRYWTVHPRAGGEH